MQSEAALLSVQKHAHEPARLIAKNAVRCGVNFAIDEFETIERFRRRRFLASGKPGANGKQRGWRLRQKGHALFEHARDEKGAPKMRVEAPTERFDPPGPRTFRITDVH